MLQADTRTSTSGAMAAWSGPLVFRTEPPIPRAVPRALGDPGNEEMLSWAAGPRIRRARAAAR
jgi:hypothetical protein